MCSIFVLTIYPLVKLNTYEFKADSYHSLPKIQPDVFQNINNFFWFWTIQEYNSFPINLEVAVFQAFTEFIHFPRAVRFQNTFLIFCALMSYIEIFFLIHVFLWHFSSGYLKMHMSTKYIFRDLTKLIFQIKNCTLINLIKESFEEKHVSEFFI